ncbi:hypothetical protein [Microbacterium thalassium]|uniref:N-acetylglutamate synthase/N-acetylornithine aminotransferase n=1 Tax=Microbacterium thalassium TaxID=362649 RepID=A0A7X0FRX9_9MICO|nr:hypothetical protein [Microbacterium thalassium]MBB6391987.1 N-acetylglutamate synthase/N-acetylornithine aminotransferase [Microbacterium thalassium]GLK24007.1 hypothetical protein GCM10017607_13250 [Microbacterium thalassium]
MIIVDPPLRRSDVARIVIGASGVALILAGIVMAIVAIPPERYASVVVWALAAIVIHDGLVAPLVVAVALIGRRTAQRIGTTAAAVARSALVAAACCTLIAVPGIVVRALGPRNETIHTVDYVVVLSACWVVAIGIAVGAVIAGAMRARHARTM